MALKSTKQGYNEYYRVYMLERYYRRKEQAIAALGGKCSLCGGTEELQFDHIDPKTKSFTIGRKLSSGSEVQLQAELLKCQLLCLPCHTDKTLRDMGRTRAKCGTLSGYRYCKCGACKSAKSEYKKAMRLKRKGSIVK